MASKRTIIFKNSTEKVVQLVGFQRGGEVFQREIEAGESVVMESLHRPRWKIVAELGEDRNVEDFGHHGLRASSKILLDLVVDVHANNNVGCGAKLIMSAMSCDHGRQLFSRFSCMGRSNCEEETKRIVPVGLPSIYLISIKEKIRESFSSIHAATWFRIELEVSDETGIAKFVLFNSEAEKLLNHTAATLLSDQDGDVYTIPQIMQNMLNRHLRFRVKIEKMSIQKGWDTHTILKTLFSLKIEEKGNTHGTPPSIGRNMNVADKCDFKDPNVERDAANMNKSLDRRSEVGPMTPLKRKIQIEDDN